MTLLLPDVAPEAGRERVLNLSVPKEIQLEREADESEFVGCRELFR